MVSFQSNKNLDDLTLLLGDEVFSVFAREAVVKFLDRLDEIVNKIGVSLNDGKKTFNVKFNGDLDRVNSWVGNGFQSRSEIIKVALYVELMAKWDNFYDDLKAMSFERAVEVIKNARSKADVTGLGETGDANIA